MFNNFFRKNIVPKTDSQEYGILINAVKELEARVATLEG